MQPQHHTHVVLAVFILSHDLLVVGVAQYRQHTALHAQRRLHHIGDVALVGFRVEVGQILAGDVLVLSQVIVGAVRHTPQLAPAEGEEELEIRGGLGVEAQLLRVMIP